MVHHSFQDAVKAFTRINTLGARLKQEDIESAQVAARHSGFIAEEVAPFLDRLKRQGFKRYAFVSRMRLPCPPGRAQPDTSPRAGAARGSQRMEKDAARNRASNRNYQGRTGPHQHGCPLLKEEKLVTAPIATLVSYGRAVNQQNC